MRLIHSLFVVCSLLIFPVLKTSGQRPGTMPDSTVMIRNQMRELSLANLKTITTGYYSIQQTDGYFYFQRFPSEILEVYNTRPAWHVRAEATSGIRIKFMSDTREIMISGSIIENSPQTEPFIILINNSVITELPERGTSGEFERSFRFNGNAENTIEICFPAYSKGSIRSLRIDRNASLVPVKRQGTILSLGNSITQQGGRYMGYTDIAARGLDLDLYNAGVGGYIFQAESLPFAFIKNPTVITVAYGTNDWAHAYPVENVKTFLDRITALYPESIIFLLEPLPRYKPLSENGRKLADNEEGRSLMDYRKVLRKIVKNYPSVSIINYKKLMPGDPALFTDGVHPSDEGHVIYGNNLLRILKKKLPDYRL